MMCAAIKQSVTVMQALRKDSTQHDELVKKI